MIRCAAGLTLLLALVACADNPQAPIEERSAGRGSTASKTAAAKPDYGKPLIVGPSYRVRLGDTLYAIAFRLGMDFQTLAAMNGIDVSCALRNVFVQRSSLYIDVLMCLRPYLRMCGVPIVMCFMQCINKWKRTTSCV